MRARLPAALLLAVTIVAGCRDDTVRVSFRPSVGDVYRYEVTVRTRSEVRLEGADPEVRSEEIVLQSEHTVLEADDDGVRVQVILADRAGSVRTFAVRFDRAAQLQAVEADALVADDEVGRFGISEIFPAASGAPPDRRLRPGERWAIEDEVAVPGAVGLAQLTGSGRLVELGSEHGEEVARLRTSSRLRLASEAPSVDGGTLHLDGEQVTTQRASHDLDDGAVRTARSSTTGTFDVEVTPPTGRRGDAVRGTLLVEVSSSTRRLD